MERKVFTIQIQRKKPFENRSIQYKDIVKKSDENIEIDGFNLKSQLCTLLE